MKVFLLEDDYNLNEAIKDSLEIYNFLVESYYDGEKALNNLSATADIYILDINTPNVIGLDLLPYIKDINPNSKVLMISANIDMEYIRKAYDLNCDDYLKKPFDVEELILKIKKYVKFEEKLQLDSNIEYDFSSKNVYVDNTIIKLTKNEKNLFYLLVKNKGLNITYSQIEDYVYEGTSKSPDAIRSLVKRLRKKVPKDLILNSLDEGYYIR